MKKTINIVIFGMLLLIFGSFMFTFQVRQDQVAFLSTTGGEPKIITKPGLYFKFPRPFQKLYEFDNRVHLEITEYTQMDSKSGSSVMLELYFGWKIEDKDPASFFTSFKGDNAKKRVENAAKDLKQLVQASGADVIKDHDTGVGFFIPGKDGTQPGNAHQALEQTEQEILTQARAKAAGKGVEIKFVGIRRVGVPQNSLDTVLDTMVREWISKANHEKKDAFTEASSITNNAVMDRTRQVETAKLEAAQRVNLAQDEARKKFEVFKKDPVLAQFLMELDALEQSVKNQTTLILDETMGAFPLLRGLNTPFLKLDQNGTTIPPE
jgi:membrane protease subunit HflC